MKAMSYFTSSVARHGEYCTRPKVEMPEKTESACKNDQFWEFLWNDRSCSYLGTTVTGQGVVPQALVWSLQWLLITSMISMSSHSSCKGSNRSKDLQHRDRETEQADHLFQQQDQTLRKLGKLSPAYTHRAQCLQS